MTVFHISVLESSRYRIDLATFSHELQRRWPGTELVQSPLMEGWVSYQLGCQPADAVLDPSLPGGLRWFPVLRTIADSTRPHQLRHLPQLNNSPVLCALMPDRRSLRLDGAGYSDCAVSAIWLRCWLPQDVPLFARQQGTRASIKIQTEESVTDLLRRLLDTNEPKNAQEDYSLLPLGVLPDEILDGLVKQVLEAGGR